jgi:hypothetical protein
MSITYSNHLVRIVSWVALSALSLSNPARGQTMDVPIATQLTLFQKILTFENGLQDRVAHDLNVGILYQDRFRASRQAKDDLVRILVNPPPTKVRGATIRPIEIDLADPDALRKIATVHVLYVAPLRAQSLAEVAQACRSNGVVSITGVADYVASGLSVGLGLRDNKPEILINKQAAEAEGAEFSAQLLRLARLVGG